MRRNLSPYEKYRRYHINRHGYNPEPPTEILTDVKILVHNDGDVVYLYPNYTTATRRKYAAWLKRVYTKKLEKYIMWMSSRFGIDYPVARNIYELPFDFYNLTMPEMKIPLYEILRYRDATIEAFEGLIDVNTVCNKQTDYNNLLRRWYHRDELKLTLYDDNAVKVGFRRWESHKSCALHKSQIAIYRGDDHGY